MGVRYVLISIHLLAALLCVHTQFYGQYPSLHPLQPYQQYVSEQPVSNGPYPSLYQYPSVYPFYPYQQYQPIVSEQPIFNRQNPTYDQHPSYAHSQYQPYVSDQPVPPSGQNYIYPAQSYAPVSNPVYNYPIQFYPQPVYTPSPYTPNQSNTTSASSTNSGRPPVLNDQNPSYVQHPYGQNYVYPAQGYPTYNSVPLYPQHVHTPYPYAVNQSNSTSPQISTNTSSQDPYANVKVDIIDIAPQDFPYYKRFFNLDDSSYPVNVADVSPVARNFQTRSQPQYIVKSYSKSYNVTNFPKGIHMHDVKSNTYSFKKTFTVDPSKNESSVVNLTFLNGVPVTDNPNVEPYRKEAAVEPVATTEETADVITTESEEPAGILTWLR